MGRAGVLTSAVPARSSLSPGHGVMACRLATLPGALSSARSASKSFRCSEQAARCPASSCLRDSAKGRAAEGQGHGEAEASSAGTTGSGVGWSGELLQALVRVPQTSLRASREQ